MKDVGVGTSHARYRLRLLERRRYRPPVPAPDPAALFATATDRLPRYLEDLGVLVGIDSGSADVVGVNAVADLVQGWLETDGWVVERHHPDAGDRPTGDVLVARRFGAGSRRIVMAAHMDTVFGPGEAARRPFAVSEAGIATGPGVCDDKAGVLAALYAVDLLGDLGALDPLGELVLVCSPDEEIGSPTSRRYLQAVGAGADVALCLEGAREDGSLVSARKGMVDVVLRVHGRAAHAGIEPERGVNAALEAAHLTIALQALNGRWEDVTVNVGVIAAGTRPNVVAPVAQLHVDVRAARGDHLDAALAAVAAIAAAPTVPGATTTLVEGERHRPMERTPATAALVARAVALGGDLGIDVRDVATGGAADANTFAALGIPVLDGLGPVGGNDHSEREFLDVGSVAPRLALLAALIADLG